MENIFWGNVVESWAEYVREPAEASDFLSQPLWNNILIEIENKPVFYRSWFDDFVDEFVLFMSPALYMSPID